MTNIVEQWLEEYLSSGRGKLYVGDGFEFIIYKGFKILRDEENTRIMDVRKTDFYSEVTIEDFNVLCTQGFVKGCDILVYNRDCKRVKYYKGRLAQKYKEREEARKQKGTVDPRRLAVRLESLDRMITDGVDKLFFFEVRKTQTENKYNLNNE